MIPNKNKTGTHRSYILSDAQKLAQRENFALFQIKSMYGRLQALNVSGHPPVVPKSIIRTVEIALAQAEYHIKSEQYYRKIAKEKNHGG